MTVEPDVLVDFVHDGDDSRPGADSRDLRELLARENATRRVPRRVEQQEARSAADGFLELFHVERVVRLAERDEARPHSGEDAGGQVVLVPRLENDRFVSRLGERQNRGDLGLRDSARDRDLPFRVGPHAVHPRVLGGDGLPELGRPPGEGILMLTRLGDRLRKSGENFTGRLEVRQSLGEVDSPDLRAEPAHLADDGLTEPVGPTRQNPRRPPRTGWMARFLSALH